LDATCATSIVNLSRPEVSKAKKPMRDDTFSLGAGIVKRISSD